MLSQHFWPAGRSYNWPTGSLLKRPIGSETWFSVLWSTLGKTHFFTNCIWQLLISRWNFLDSKTEKIGNSIKIVKTRCFWVIFVVDVGYSIQGQILDRCHFLDFQFHRNCAFWEMVDVCKVFRSRDGWGCEKKKKWRENDRKKKNVEN